MIFFLHKSAHGAHAQQSVAPMQCACGKPATGTIRLLPAGEWAPACSLVCTEALIETKREGEPLASAEKRRDRLTSSDVLDSAPANELVPIARRVPPEHWDAFFWSHKWFRRAMKASPDAIIDGAPDIAAALDAALAARSYEIVSRLLANDRMSRAIAAARLAALPEDDDRLNAVRGLLRDYVTPSMKTRLADAVERRQVQELYELIDGMQASEKAWIPWDELLAAAITAHSASDIEPIRALLVDALLATGRVAPMHDVGPHDPIVLKAVAQGDMRIVMAIIAYNEERPTPGPAGFFSDAVEDPVRWRDPRELASDLRDAADDANEAMRDYVDALVPPQRSLML